MLRAITPLYSQIYQHPFNLGLHQGTLAKSSYTAFLLQDRIYLGEFAAVLRKIADRFPSDTQYQHIFYKLSAYIAKTEQYLHDKYLNADKTQDDFIQMSPSVSNYTQYLHHTVERASLPEAVASCLPCFCLYSDLGSTMKKRGISETNPYRLWIESYSSKQFLLSKELIVNTACELATHQNLVEEKMIVAFKQSTLFEIAFWDSACIENKLIHRNKNTFFQQSKQGSTVCISQPFAFFNKTREKEEKAHCLKKTFRT